MAKSYRLEVLHRLQDLLKGITPANNFDHDLSSSVFCGRALFGDSDPMPMVSILESTKVDGGVLTGYNDEARKGMWPLIIQGWVENDLVRPTDAAYNLMADVESMLGRILATNASNGNPTWPDAYMLGQGNSGKGYLISGITFGPGVVSPPREQVSSNAFFFLPLYLTLAEKLGQPYYTV